ncbi:MAG TPA: calcium-binding protein [Acidocella sp.]|jgi:hypothetical protein|uniref:calcium-binding protein n=1 Tax=Acidocella sp. TaxID=50710 RepID=UPI002BEF9FBC|nr:calcium-binding protein [Acidocella sp.]HVE21151.1 calcium-binding protein [Acidocella sp.]
MATISGGSNRLGWNNALNSARWSVQCGAVLGVLLTSACSMPNTAKPPVLGPDEGQTQTRMPPVAPMTAPTAPTPLATQLTPLPGPAPYAAPQDTAATHNVTLGTGANITVIGSSGNDVITVGAPTQSVIAGTGKSTVNVPAYLASAKVVGRSPAKTTLHIITPGTAALSDEDSNITVKLTPGTNNLSLGQGANITAVGTPGTDAITVGAPTQSVIAGSGTDTVNASSDLAGVKVVGHGQAVTTLVITTGGNATLNNADSNLTVVLNGGAGGPSFHDRPTALHPHAWRKARPAKHWHVAAKASPVRHGAHGLACPPTSTPAPGLK